MIKLFELSWTFVTSKLNVTNILLFLFIAAGAYLFWIVIDDDRSSLFRSKIFKILKIFTKIHSIDKKYISNDIKGRLNLARRDIYCGDMILPKAIDVDWVDCEAPSSYEIKEGEFIVRLNPSTEQHQNIVHLARAIIKRTSLIGIKHLVQPTLKEAIEVNLTRSLLLKSRNDDAVTWFYKNIFQPISEEEGELKDWNRQIVEIDEQGLFNALLLVEFEDFSRRISGMQPRAYMINQINSFVKHIHSVATKKEGEIVNLDFRRAHLRVSIILVAKVDTVLNQGIEPYLDAAKININNQVNSIYLIIWGKSYLKKYNQIDHFRYNRRCNRLIKSIEKLPGAYKYLEVQKYTYIDPSGRRRSGRLIRYATEQE